MSNRNFSSSKLFLECELYEGCEEDSREEKIKSWREI